MSPRKLGPRIRKSREARGLTQEELAQKIQKVRRLDNHIKLDKQKKVDKGTISDWENGHQIPSPDNIYLGARALELTYEEEIYWLGLAGHLKPSPVPTGEQVIDILEVYCKQIQQHRFPALIVDHRNNLWAINPAASAFVGGYKNAVDLMREQVVNLFDLSFNNDIGFGDDLAEPGIFRRQQIVLFLITNLYRRHEPFWQSYPQYWVTRLSESDYQEFEKIWNEVSTKYLDSFSPSERFIREVVKYTHVKFLTPSGKSIMFKVLAESPSYFFNNFFQVLYYTLVDEKDRPEAEHIFNEFWGKDASQLMQWNIPDRNIDDILASYMK